MKPAPPVTKTFNVNPLVQDARLPHLGAIWKE